MRLILSVISVLLAYQSDAVNMTAGTPVLCDPAIINSCILSCDHGYRRQANGCHSCQCETEICKDVQCAIGKVCKEFKLSSSGHKLTRCVDPRLPIRCHGPMDNGPCQAFISRLHYNSEGDFCEPFMYGGCKGNDNNFMTLEDCQTTCLPKDLLVGCDEISAVCELQCEHGYKVDASNCQLCECADPDPLEPFGTDCPEPLTTCLMSCDSGFKNDIRGCAICECNDPPGMTKCNTPRQCKLVCPGGFKNDRSGCKICECTNQCPDVMCAIHCDHGFQTDPATGCDICVCEDTAKCGETTCSLDCKYGLERDLSGCGICTCKDSCPDVLCARSCQLGYKKDEYGCDKCDCEEEHACNEVMCAMFCENGFQKDESGCDICKCNEPCPEVMCARYCEHGFKKDKYGCDKCDCEEEHACNEVMCAMFCKNGFQKDSYGCDICKCNEPCPELTCTKHCEYGNKKNINGCDTCDCVDAAKCNEVMCAMYCASGFQKDENGCNICKCNTEKHQCQTNMCRMMCQFGFVKDSYGCDTCRCAGDPCTFQLTSCPQTQVCETKHQEGCSHCAATAHCIDISSVKKIRVQLRFAHGVMEEVDIDVLSSHLRTRIGHLLGTDEEYIRGLVVERPDDDITDVTFYVVSYGYWNLVSAYKRFEMDVKTHMLGTSFKYEDVLFVPQHRTLSVQYYEDPDVLDGSDSAEYEHENSSASMSVIIGCTIAGIIALVLIILALVFIARSRKYHNDRPNVAYVRAPEPKMDTIITEKPPLV